MKVKVLPQPPDYVIVMYGGEGEGAFGREMCAPALLAPQPFIGFVIADIDLSFLMVSV